MYPLRITPSWRADGQLYLIVCATDENHSKLILDTRRQKSYHWSQLDPDYNCWKYRSLCQNEYLLFHVALTCTLVTNKYCCLSRNKLVI